jgi:ribosome-binding factor A
MAGQRMRRVDEAVREVLSDALGHRDLKDPRIGFVTVTDVKTSTDLRHARVYVSVLGSEEEREATLEGLRSSHGVIQSRIAAETRMKRTPTLTFRYDDTIEQGVRISELLEEGEEE